MDKLTPIQLKALSYIRTSMDRNGTTPTLRELCHHMGYSAIGSAQDLIAALRRKGFLEETSKQSARSLVPTVAARDIFEDADDVYDPFTLVLPCLGSVPAGSPIEAIEDRIGTLRISASMIPKPHPPKESLFALKAKGESMIHAGILDGDWLVVASQKSAPIASIVVARLDGDATVKRLMKDQNRGWYLKPENPLFKPNYAEDRPFEIIGKVVALQRSF
ncbi:MAG: transcriptional repressor LexA [Proteobacteria bacterium]|nr:transcriptional repressor LexA [Pseudomonadota bacterium]